MAEQATIPKHLEPCEILKVHDDGDLTLKCQGKGYVVTTEGEVFKEVKETPDEPDMLAMFLVAHSMPHMDSEHSPGIVVYPDVALHSPCKCASINGSELCFSHGIIGAMDEEQKAMYCQPRMQFESEALTRHFQEFQEAVRAAQARIKDIPKGERLQPWLEAMSDELGKRGIEV